MYSIHLPDNDTPGSAWEISQGEALRLLLFSISNETEPLVAPAGKAAPCNSRRKVLTTGEDWQPTSH